MARLLPFSVGTVSVDVHPIPGAIEYIFSIVASVRSNSCLVISGDRGGELTLTQAQSTFGRV
jgi:hypothetical protein